MDKRLVALEAQMMIEQAYVQYWTSYATSPANLKRNVMVGDHVLQKDELIDDAMECALQHIRVMQECRETMLMRLDELKAIGIAVFEKK